MKRIWWLSLALLPQVSQAYKVDFDLVDAPSQADFKDASKDMAAAFNFKSMAPAESGSIAGFALGVFASYVPTDNSHVWERLTGKKIDEFGTVGVIAQKGLPFGIDLGASYAAVPGADARVFGAEARVEVIEGDLVTPAVSLRATYSELAGVDDLDYHSIGTDLSVSKGFGPFTPYGGVGYVWSTFEADDQFDLKDEDIDRTRVFVGVRIAAFFGITPEYERVGNRDSFNLRAGFNF